MSERSVEGPAVPAPSIFPALVAAGVTLVAAGLVTNWIIAAAGLIAAVWGIAGWVQVLRHE